MFGDNAIVGWNTKMEKIGTKIMTIVQMCSYTYSLFSSIFQNIRKEKNEIHWNLILQISDCKSKLVRFKSLTLFSVGSESNHVWPFCLIFISQGKLLQSQLVTSAQYPACCVYNLHHTILLQTTELVSFLRLFELAKNGFSFFCKLEKLKKHEFNLVQA